MLAFGRMTSALLLLSLCAGVGWLVCVVLGLAKLSDGGVVGRCCAGLARWLRWLGWGKAVGWCCGGMGCGELG